MKSVGRPALYTPGFRIKAAEGQRPRYKSMRRDIYDYVADRDGTQIRFIQKRWGTPGRNAAEHMLREGQLAPVQS